jgi:hypothetical protein
VVTDFSYINNDRLVFGTAHEGQLEAKVVNGDDIEIVSNLTGDTVLVEDLWSELGLNLLPPEDVPGNEAEYNAALLNYLEKTDFGEGKGVIYFENKCVDVESCDPDRPDTGWEGTRPEYPFGRKPLDGFAGDTLPNTTVPDFVDRYLDDDQNVWYAADSLNWDLLAE